MTSLKIRIRERTRGQPLFVDEYQPEYRTFERFLFGYSFIVCEQLYWRPVPYAPYTGHAKTRLQRPQAPANLIKGTAAVSAEYAGVKRTRTPRGSVRVQE